MEQVDLTHIAHQANLYHTFGSGIAKEIKRRFPRAYEADLRTAFADKTKLGSWSFSLGSPTILNLYTQVGISHTDRTTSYDAMSCAFAELVKVLSLRQKAFPVKLGMPYKIGCGLAGGDWEVVNALLVHHFEKAPFELVICRLG